MAGDGGVSGTGWIDVTVPIHDGMVHWPGDPEVRVARSHDVEHGDEMTLTRLELSAHTGTHVDAPVHFVRGGAGIDVLPMSQLLGPARVVHVPDAETITARHVDAAAAVRGERLLFKTRNSDRCWKTEEFVADYTYVSVDGARRLVERGVQTVGLDYLSVGGGEHGPEIHRVLLAAGVCVIEGVDLSGVEPGAYDLLCLPLRVRGGDGAPARVLLRPRR